MKVFISLQIHRVEVDFPILTPHLDYSKALTYPPKRLLTISPPPAEVGLPHSNDCPLLISGFSEKVQFTLKLRPRPYKPSMMEGQCYFTYYSQQTFLKFFMFLLRFLTATSLTRVCKTVIVGFTSPVVHLTVALAFMSLCLTSLASNQSDSFRHTLPFLHLPSSLPICGSACTV